MTTGEDRQATVIRTRTRSYNRRDTDHLYDMRWIISMQVGHAS